MRDKAFPAQKPVMIEQVVDDVRALRGDETSQQKIVLSGRAVADLLKGDSFERSNPSDANYFADAVTDTIDLNKVTDGSIRHLRSGQFTHGPDSVSGACFLHVYSVLESGTLTWDDVEAVDPQINKRGGSPIAIRQVLYPGDLNTFSAFTRVAKYNKMSGTFEWSRWDPLGGTMLRVLITEATAVSLKTLAPNTIYEIHCAPGFEIQLPNAMNYAAGTKIAFEQYPDPKGAIAWSSLITYTEANGEVYSTTAVPNIDRARTSAKTVTGAEMFSEPAGPLYYEFEVTNLAEKIEGSSGTLVDRTWQANVDAECLERTADMAELLASHTDPSLEDFVMYGARTFTSANNATRLLCTQIATMSGFVRWSVAAINGKHTSLTSNWGFKLYVFNAETASSAAVNYSKVDITYSGGVPVTKPNATTHYYVKNGSTYILAGVGGFLSEFLADRDYYTQNIDPDQMVPVATVNKADLATAKIGYYNANRGDTLLAVITSSGHNADKAFVSPIVEFYPDPHDAYVMKINVNNKSFTLADLAAAVKPGADADQVAGATALATAYESIVHTLQRRGRMWGVKFTGDLNNLVTPGTYSIQNGASLTNAPTDRAEASGTIIVFANEFADGEKLYDADGKAVTAANRFTQIYFCAKRTGATCAMMWMRTGFKSGTTLTWSPWVFMQPGPAVFDASGAASISATQMAQYLANGNPFITIGHSSPITVTLPDPKDYKNVKCQFEVKKGSSPVTFTFTTGGNTYSHTTDDDTANIEANDRYLYPMESDGQYWYLTTIG